MITFNSGTYRQLQVFPEMGTDASAMLCLRSDTHSVAHTAQNRMCVTFALQKHTVYALDTGGATVRLAYLTDADDLLERGVRFVGLTETIEPVHAFCPRFGLFLAPSAFCFYKGYYHMLYRCDLFGNGQTYFAHAVSRDLCTWRDLPVAFTPPAEMCRSDYRAGGVFEGAIDIEDEGVRLYYTNRIYEKQSERELLRYSMTSESRDMLHFTESVPLLFSEETASLCEGPHLAETAHGKHLIFGGSDKDAAAAFLYRKEGATWRKSRHELREKREKVWKNAALFRIGKTHAALGTFPKKEGEEMRWYTGTFREDTFRVRNRGTVDFGGDFLFPQSFAAKERRILFGKIGDALSHPRELTVRKGRLCVLPAREVYEKTGAVLYQGRGETVCFRPQYGAYMAEVTFCGETESRMQFGEGADAVIFTAIGGKCAFSKHSAYSIGTVSKLLFLVERDSVEVFINDGETAGTKKGVCGGFFKASFSAPAVVSSLSVRALLPPDKEEEDLSFLCGETFEF